MLRKILLLTALTVAVGCSDVVQNEDVYSEGRISVRVAFDWSEVTRIDISEGDGGSWELSWSEDDCLGGWSTSADYSTQSLFEIAQGGYDASSSEFEGNAIFGSGDMRLLYPYSEQLVKSASNTISLSLAEQSAASDFSALSKNIYMISDSFAADATTVLSPKMKHLGAAIELQMLLDDNNNAADYSLKEVLLEDIMATEGLLNLTDGTLTTTAGDMTITTDGVEAGEGGIYTLRFATFPFTLAAGGSLRLVATLVDSDGVEYWAECTLETSAEVEFARATNNTIYARLGELTADVTTPDEPQQLTIDDSTSATFPSAATTDTAYSVGEVDFIAVGFYYYSYYSCYILKSGGYLYTTTPLSALSRLEINEDGDYYRIAVYAGSALNPTETALSYTKTTTTYNAKSSSLYTYEIPAGSCHLRIAHDGSSSNSAYLNAFTISY